MYVSSVENVNASVGSEYDGMVTWSKVMNPETLPELLACSDESVASFLFGENEVQSLSIRLNVDSRQLIRALRIFKENDGKRIPTELRPLLLALTTIQVCTAECEG